MTHSIKHQQLEQFDALARMVFTQSKNGTSNKYQKWERTVDAAILQMCFSIHDDLHKWKNAFKSLEKALKNLDEEKEDFFPRGIEADDKTRLRAGVVAIMEIYHEKLYKSGKLKDADSELLGPVADDLIVANMKSIDKAERRQRHDDAIRLLGLDAEKHSKLYHPTK